MDDRPMVSWEPLAANSRVSGSVAGRVHHQGIGTLGPPGSTLRLRHFDAIVHGKKRLVRLLKALNTVAKVLGAPDVAVETASGILRRYLDAVNAEICYMRRERALKLALASLYLACRLHGYPITAEEVSQAGDPWELWEHVRELIERTGLKAPPPDPALYVRRIATSVGATRDAMALASAIVAHARASGRLSGANPVTLACAAVYLASVLLSERIPGERFEVFRNENAVRREAKRLARVLRVEVEI
ncbi:MAG: hypothetical protein QXK07_06485 [Desulfurococcaceae archaeon]